MKINEEDLPEEIKEDNKGVMDIVSLGKYYNMFFGTGFAGLVIIVGLIVYIIRSKYQRSSPMGIMLHMLAN